MSPSLRKWLWLSVAVVAFIGISAAVWTYIKVKQIKSSIIEGASTPRSNKGFISLVEHKKLKPFISYLNLDLLLDLVFNYSNRSIKFLVYEEFFEIFEINKWLDHKVEVKFLGYSYREKIKIFEEAFSKKIEEISQPWRDQNYDLLYIDNFNEEVKKIFLGLKHNPKSIVLLLAKNRQQNKVLRQFLLTHKRNFLRWKNRRGAFFVIFNK